MNIEPRRDKAGKVISYRVRSCVGRDEQRKQVWRTCTIPRPEGLTPKREEDEVWRLADAWEQEQKAEFQRSHEKKDLSRITLSDFIRDVWWPLHVMDGSHKPTSVEFYRHLSNGVLEYFEEQGNKKLAQLSAADVKRYIIYLQTEARTKDGEPLSQTTIIRHYQTLRNVLNFAIRFGYLRDDPCKNLSVKDKPRNETKTICFLEADEARRFMAALEEEPLFWRTFETVLITCGLRRGEAIGLQWRDIDTEKRLISVRRNVTIDTNSTEKYAVTSPKSGKGRTVPLPARVEALLKALRQEQEARLNVKILPSAYVFSRRENPYAPIYPTEPTRWQSKFVKRHGLKNVSPHDLRHSFAALSLESGANIKQIQQTLGHQDVSTTLGFYAGVSQEAERRAVEGVERLLAENGD